MNIKPKLFNNIAKPSVFFLLLIPLLVLIAGFYSEALGANPVEYIIRSLGEWSLRILLMALMISPLSRLLKWTQLVQLRRVIGLFTFFYASLHFLSYLVFEQSLDIKSMINDIWERPFIAVGFVAFITLLPLAVTSTRSKMRRMGVRWKILHRLVYLAVILCVVHYWWLVKADVSDPTLYASLTAVVLFERVWRWSKHKSKS